MSNRRKNKPVNRLRAKRFESEIVKTCDLLLDTLNANEELRKEFYPKFKTQVGKMIKRLLDGKLLREQDFYIGDWVMSVNDKHSEPAEIIDINYTLRTARIRDKVEGEIWVKFQDIVKDEDVFALV